MANPTFKIEGANEIARELHRRRLNVESGLEEILHAAGGVIQEAAAANVRATSQSVADEMARATMEKRPDRVVVGVGPTENHWHSHMIEFGARAHRITAKNRKALQFINGTFRRSVQHPGFAPRPFLRPALDTRKDEAQAVAAREFKRKTGAA